MEGEGKYDQVCTMARLMAKANNIMLLVIDGEHGPGFSAHSDDPQFEQRIPGLLRQVADAIEQDNQKDIDSSDN